MATLDYLAFDADHHYYEAEDAFIRHLDPKLRKRCMQWTELEGRRRLLVGGKVNRFIPNPTFDPVAKPGVLDSYFRGKNPEGKGIGALFGDLDPIDPAYRDRDARIAQLDTQGIEKVFLFPTLGVGMEESLKHDPEACVAAFTAFNRWIDDDWGFAYQDRIYGAPYITLLDVDAAVENLRHALERDARIVCLRAGPVALPGGSRSLADERFDPFWSLANESGITVAFHSGDAGYNKFADEWGSGGEFKSFDYDPLRVCLSPEPIMDTMAAMVCHGLYDRHPNLRIATIEAGSSWVGPLLRRLRKAYGQLPFRFQHDPVEQFKAHVFVSPYYEDDLETLRDTIGADHVLFGSDYPHAEGLAEPVSYIHDLKGFSDDEIRLTMRENALGLSVRRPA